MAVVDPPHGVRSETDRGHTESDVTEALDRVTEICDEWRTRSVRDCEQVVLSGHRSPFSGVKDPGYGRERSEAGTKAFVNHTTVWVER